MATSTSSSSDASSVVIDERRAQQLMERAMGLAERGDTSSAILACRQAISLVPNSSQSYSMLGLLLERSGDAAGAITAYEKVLELAPDSLLERESLGRLRATTMPRRNLRENSFYEEDDERTEDLPTAPGVVGSVPTDTTQADGVSEAMLEAAATRTATDALSAPVPTLDFTPVDEAVQVKTTEAQAAASDAIVEAVKSHEAAAGSVQSSVPVSAETTLPFASTTARPAPSIFDPNAPLSLPPKEKPLTTGQKLRQHPSFYFRSLPLSAAASVSILFLLWAHTVAPPRVSNQLASDIPNQVLVEDLPPEPAAETPPRPNPTVGAAPANPTATAPTATAPVAPPPTVAAAPSNPATAPSGAAPAEPAAGPPAQLPASRPDNVPPRSTTAPAAAPAPATPQAASGGASAGGAPVNPAGSPNRSYVPVGPAGRSPVARPENNAAADEQAAGNDARSGRADSALERLSRAIESGGSDVAFRYQQRAQMYLQSGDGTRAVADFQAAINAYEAMISRGDRVTIARSGIQACRRGMQLAVSRR